MSKLEDIVPPLELCKEAAEKFPEAWRRDFCPDEWHQPPLCWRTFNKEKNDEYTIVFFTGSLDYENGDVNAPTVAEIIATLDGEVFAPTVYRQADKWYATAEVEPDDLIDAEGKTAAEAAMNLWMKVQNEKMKHEK